MFIGRHEPENHEFRESLKTKFENELFRKEKTAYRLHIPLLVIFAFMISMSLNRGMITFILSPFLSEEKGIEITQAALFIGVSTLIGSTGQLLGGYFGDKHGEDRVLSFGSLSMVFILFIIYVTDLLPLLFLAYISLGVVNAIFWPGTNSLVAKNSKHKGQAFGLVMLIANLVGALGPFMVGILRVIDPSSYLSIFLIAGGFSLLAVLFLEKLKSIMKN
jgi:MFS family permease